MCDHTFGVGPDYQIPDALWAQMVRVLPSPKVRKQDGRPRMEDRHAMTAIVYVLRPGCPWKALPRSLGAPSTVHDRFQEWRAAQVFERLWQAGLLTFETLKGLEWAWQAMDGAMTKAPLGGETGGQQPHRSRQARDHTARADGRPGPAPRHRRGGRQSP
jgi:putative transposase